MDILALGQLETICGGSTSFVGHLGPPADIGIYIIFQRQVVF